MVGGSDDVFRACLPMFELMGRSITHMGRAGSGQHTKMVNQILISTCMIGVCEGLLYAQKAGLPLESVLAAVGSGAAGSWSLSNYGPRILTGNFDPGFFVEVIPLEFCFRGVYAAHVTICAFMFIISNLTGIAAALCQRHVHRSRRGSAHAACPAWSRTGPTAVYSSRCSRSTFQFSVVIFAPNDILNRFFVGHGKKGTQSLILALQTLNGIPKNS